MFDSAGNGDFGFFYLENPIKDKESVLRRLLLLKHSGVEFPPVYGIRRPKCSTMVVLLHACIGPHRYIRA